MTWTVQYEANELPDAATPAWNTYGGLEGEAIVDGKLHWVATGSAGYADRDGLDTAGAETTMEAKVKIEADGTDASGHFGFESSNSEGKVYTCKVYDGKVTIVGAFSASPEEELVAVTTDDYHTYRILNKGATAELYVDDILALTTGGAEAEYAVDYFDFFTEATGTDVYIDYVYFYTDGAEVPESLIDRYTNYEYDDLAINSEGGTKEGQSFACVTGGVLNSAGWYVKKVGSPTGNAVARIYAVTGTHGVDAKPTGDPLATSDNLDVSTLAETAAWTAFSFAGAEKITLSDATNYIVSIEYDGGDMSNCIKIGWNEMTATHEGNPSYFIGGEWASDAVMDYCFYVYVDGPEAEPEAASTSILKPTKYW